MRRTSSTPTQRAGTPLSVPSLPPTLNPSSQARYTLLASGAWRASLARLEFRRMGFVSVPVPAPYPLLMMLLLMLFLLLRQVSMRGNRENKEEEEEGKRRFGPVIYA
ncbi:hypothetical protein DL769_007780 [Monosporascus sp. CRB-8-3]|nr:hypothetical protein DL769_007780 [Monosporascus sp. CRB-8-3]